MGRARFYILSGTVANKFLHLAKLLRSKELKYKLGMKENVHFQVLAAPEMRIPDQVLVSSRPATLTDSIGINCGASATDRRSDQRALLATGNSAN